MLVVLLGALDSACSIGDGKKKKRRAVAEDFTRRDLTRRTLRQSRA